MDSNTRALLEIADKVPIPPLMDEVNFDDRV
jgi:hypothetical protein